TMSEEEDELKEIIPIPLLSGDGDREDLSSLPIRITMGDLKNVPTHVINYVDDFKQIKKLFVFFKPTEEYKDTFYFDEIYGIIDLKTKVLQKFEVQGLSALSAYEAIYVFEDIHTYGIIGVNFISSKVQERILVKFYKISYIMVPHTCDNPIDARKLFQLRLDSESNSQDASEQFLYPNVVISDFIVGVWDNKLWIQTLVRETKEWTEYLREELHDYNRIQIQFCAEEIELMMEDTLAQAKIYLNYNETRVIKKKRYYNGYLYTWIVEETDDNTFLTAWIFDHKALAWSKVGNKIQTFLSDIKLLTSEDIVAISSKGIFVWTVVKDHGIKLLYYWGSVKIAKPNAYYYELVVDQIEFLNDKLVFSKNSLPPPSFSQLISHPSHDCYMDTRIIVFAFAHSLHILLRPISDYSYDQPSYTDDVNNPWNLATRYQPILPNGTIENGSSLIETPDANINMFALFSTAIVAVYFMLTGDSSSISSWVLKDNWTLVFLLAIFSFFTTIYLMNLFIGLLGMAIDETNNVESFLHLKGEILAEIELFWMLPYQRRKKNWFPDILYYEASIEELQNFVKKAQNEGEDTFSPHLSDSILKISQVDIPIEVKAREIGIKIDKYEEKLNKILDALEKLNSNHQG
ncbi:36528_t:CDS:2, partial [Racocetra persica]